MDVKCIFILSMCNKDFKLWTNLQVRNDLTRYYKYVYFFFSPHNPIGLHTEICKHLHTNPQWDFFPCLACRAGAAEMMDHIIRLEEYENSQQLDLQFTVPFFYV